MNNDEEKIPPFVQDYLNKMDHEGYADFVKLSRDYHKEKEEYPGKYEVQLQHLNDFNRATGQNRQLNFDDGLSRIDNQYKRQAYQVAKQHGYNGPDPNQPSDKEFTKQGEKFQIMIESARERQQQKAQKQEQGNADEKKNTETPKEQQPYQQNKANVEFKGTAQEKPSGGEQLSREQKRAEFLAQAQQVREKQTQERSQGKQPEI